MLLDMRDPVRLASHDSIVIVCILGVSGHIHEFTSSRVHESDRQCGSQ